MKNFIILFSLLFGLSGAAFAIENSHENPNSSDAEVQESFHSIELKGNFEVYLSQGTSSSYHLEGEEGKLEAYIENGVLYVQSSGKSWDGANGVLHIVVNDFRSMKSAGAIELETSGMIKADYLELKFAGACEISMDLKANKLRLETAGASEVELRGSATYADFHSAGATEIEASEFKVRSLGIETAGASELEVYVTDELKVKARGASEIAYRGRPAHIHRDLKGATSLEAI